MKKAIIAAVLAAVAIPSAPAFADPPPWAPAHGRRAHDREREYDGGRDRGYYSSGYDRYGRYSEPRRLNRDDRIWRGRDGRYYCRRGNGTTGLIIGAGVGALLGRSIDNRGDRALGTILGAAGGGLLGREIDRGNVRCR
ncbi:glycine zipper 2TM domain-containing protein [Novosphingobium sp. KCTC 2891]|uniref:glycine zipper 2TM domain-containing protein n=1 Tax=Novosphingobium sp. KCTC 2891 TaxID=2989730 RepID=UPI002221546D|nr:glycine zipper 2TM domain-containing protein [Novosphingobium sp. KCTC 2891]MCW1382901.1 glycine zipper 2TM domain-containing protein [Novosphingobium sp. KCTC 2891]